MAFESLLRFSRMRTWCPRIWRYASDWKARFDLTFPVVADPAVAFDALENDRTQMGWYYNTSLAPMQMLVNAKTMQILSLDVGATTDTLYAKIQGNL